MSIGETLAAARREAGLTITQVSQRTCIRETIVRGIERDDYSACGGDFYARGHIRSIARAVGADPDELVREYDATHAAPHPISAAEVFQPYTPVRVKDRRRPNWSIVLLVGLVAVLGIAGWRVLGSHGGNSNGSRNTASTQTDRQHKKSTTTAPAAHTAPQHVQLSLYAKTGQVTWAEATSGSGKILFEGYLGQGYMGHRVWTAGHQITLQLGNPAATTLYLNGNRQTYERSNSIVLVCSRTSCAPRTG